MRTTLNIDDSILKQLKEEAHRTDSPLKQIVNTALELGLRHLKKKAQSRQYRLKTYSLGFPPAGNLDKALRLASDLENDEIVRKLELKK